MLARKRYESVACASLGCGNSVGIRQIRNRSRGFASETTAAQQQPSAAQEIGGLDGLLRQVEIDFDAGSIDFSRKVHPPRCGVRLAICWVLGLWMGPTFYTGQRPFAVALRDALPSLLE